MHTCIHHTLSLIAILHTHTHTTSYTLIIFFVHGQKKEVPGMKNEVFVFHALSGGTTGLKAPTHGGRYWFWLITFH